MDEPTRKKICQLVAGIIIADDILETKEEAFIDRVIKSFGIDDPSREVIFPLVDHKEAAEQIKELARPAQEEAVRLLIEAACVDGEIVPEERDYLRAIGAALLISEAELARRIERELASGS
ncbi:MAG: TerB family tellurite resistance protein [Kofleriaceae bacterium]